MQNAFKIILETSIYSSIMIAFVLLVKSFLSGKLSTRIMSLLWIAVLIRLAMPITLESPVHLIALTPPSSTVASNITNEDVTIADNASVDYIDNYNYLPTNNNEIQNTIPTSGIQKASIFQKAKSLIANISLWSVAFIIWAIGAVFVFTKSAIRNIVFRKKIMGAQIVNVELEEELINAKATLDIRCNIKISESNCVNIPLVHGALNPIVIMPIGFSQSIKRSKLKLIIMHELCHIKRGDIFINFCWLAVKSLHWFNPLVQIAYKSYLSNIEEACDEMMLHYLTNSDKFDYPQSLLDVMRLTKNKRSIPSALSLCSSDSSIKRRVIKMIKPIKKSKTTSIVTLLVSLVMIFACFTTACQPKVAKDKSVQPEAFQETNIITEGTTSPTPASEILAESKVTEVLQKTTTYDSDITEGDSKEIITKMDIPKMKDYLVLDIQKFYGDNIYHLESKYEDAYGSTETYEFLESDKSLISYHDPNLSSAIPFQYTLAKYKEKALEYIEEIWEYTEVSTLSNYMDEDKIKKDYYYEFTGKSLSDERVVYICLNGEGDLITAQSYPKMDLSKGVSMDKAYELALEELKRTVYIANTDKLNLVDKKTQQPSNSYSLHTIYSFSFEYRTSSPMASEFNYNCEVDVNASNGEIDSEIIPIIKGNPELIQQDVAEQIAKEHIAEVCYGSSDMWDRLETVGTYIEVNEGDYTIGKIIYNFTFNYLPKEPSDKQEENTHYIAMLATGEFYDLHTYPTEKK